MKRPMAEERLRSRAVQPLRLAALRPPVLAQLCDAGARHFRQLWLQLRARVPAEAQRLFRDDGALQ
jgi:hypothetical protein